MNIRKLARMPYAQACVHEYRKDFNDKENCDVLVSYQKAVLEIHYDEHKVYCAGLYSRTTIKHIGAFMREKGMDYFIAKACVKGSCCYDFVTGEYIPL